MTRETCTKKTESTVKRIINPVSWIAGSLNRQFSVAMITALTIASIICLILFIALYHKQLAQERSTASIAVNSKRRVNAISCRPCRVDIACRVSTDIYRLIMWIRGAIATLRHCMGLSRDLMALKRRVRPTHRCQV